MKKAPKRIIFNVPEELHKLIKERADLKYITITKWVLQAVLEKIAIENKYINPEPGIFPHPTSTK